MDTYQYNQGGSPFTKFTAMIVIIAGLVGLYYLYQYLFGSVGIKTYNILDPVQNANIDPSSPIIVPTSNLPSIYEGGEFTVSMWLYITNWNYRSGFNKHILSIGGKTFDTVRVYLGGVKPSLSIRINSHDKDNKTDVLSKSTFDTTFNTLQTDSGLLESGIPLCDLPELDLQKWVNVTIAINGKSADVYMDGKLSRSCILPSFYKVDAGGYVATLLSAGGFGGKIANVTLYDGAVNPEVAYNIYMSGPEPITDIYSWLKSFFTPSQTL
jgi:hypothetical protein